MQNLSILQCKVYETIQQIPVGSVMVTVAFCSARCMKQHNRFLSDLMVLDNFQTFSIKTIFRDGRFSVNYHRKGWKVSILSFGTVFYY